MKKIILAAALLSVIACTGRSKVTEGLDVPDSGISVADVVGADGHALSDSPISSETSSDLPVPPDGCEHCVDIIFDLSDATDVPLPPDAVPELPPELCEQCDDLKPDLPPLPAGCCYDQSDCPEPDGGPTYVCVGLEWDWFGGVGVCMPQEESPWCWTDGECANGEYCHNAAACGCQMDCDMLYEGPGICVPENAGCVAIEEEWVDEYCNDTSVVLFDGEKCVATCPGCCHCAPFCDFVFDTMIDCLNACKGGQCQFWDGGCDDAMPEYPWWYYDQDTGKCASVDTCMCEGCPGVYISKAACELACLGEVQPTDCPLYLVSAGADCPYGLFKDNEGCDDLACLADGACTTDTDCLLLGDALVGEYCVAGNCVFCWQDTQCIPGELCRDGRCVPEIPPFCPPQPPCWVEGCHLITPSEAPCPVCSCDSVYSLECEKDMDCLVISFHPFSRCVYGRCADCRNDDDCDWGRCIQPGICYQMEPPNWELWGTWLIGWGGGMDHFSYFRFEPDGTLRRGAYTAEGPFADDIPPLPCYPGMEPPPSPLLGTWEPEVTQSGFLVIRVSLNISCDAGPGFTARFAVNVSEDGMSAAFDDIDGDMDYQAFRMGQDDCTPDFGACVLPDIW